jgi:hypothetical protein
LCPGSTGVAKGATMPYRRQLLLQVLKHGRQYSKIIVDGRVKSRDHIRKEVLRLMSDFGHPDVSDIQITCCREISIVLSFWEEAHA